MWVIICQQNIYRVTNNTASRPTDWDGSVCHLDGYDASIWLRYCNSVKPIWSGKIKTWGTRLCETMLDIICQLYENRRTYKMASRATGGDGIAVLLYGFDVSWWLRYCNAVKLILTSSIKQMWARLIWKYVGYCMSTKHIKTDI